MADPAASNRDVEQGYVPLGRCERGAIYRLRSRNLAFGAYDGEEGFIGIREKFGQRYLFTEYHWDQGPPFGTAKPLDRVAEVPNGIELRELNPESRCPSCRKEVERDEAAKSWRHRDDRSPICGESLPYVTTYEPLFELLERVEAEHGTAS